MKKILYFLFFLLLNTQLAYSQSSVVYHPSEFDSLALIFTFPDFSQGYIGKTKLIQYEHKHGRPTVNFQLSDSSSIDSYLGDTWLSNFKPRLPEQNWRMGKRLINTIRDTLSMNGFFYSMAYYDYYGHLMIWESLRDSVKLKAIYPHFAGGGLYMSPTLKRGIKDALIIDIAGGDAGEAWGGQTYLVHKNDTVFVPKRTSFRERNGQRKTTKTYYDIKGNKIRVVEN